MSHQPQVLILGDFPSQCLSGLHSMAELVYISTQTWQDYLKTGLDALPSSIRPEQVLGMACYLAHPVSLQVFQAFTGLKLIANLGVGVDHIDMEAASSHQVVVSNTPGLLDETVADFTWALMLACGRRLVESHQYAQSGQFTGWHPELHLGVDIFGKTLGLFGCGEIGQKVAQRAQGFNMRVLYTQRHALPKVTENRLGLTYVPFETLLQKSDIISLHCPLTDETRGRFNAEALQQMKPGSILINTARGPVVDEAALAACLKSGHLFSAGLDVFEREPLIHPDLLGCKNAVLAAHIGSASTVTRLKMAQCVADNLTAMLTAKPLLTPVN